MGNNNLSNDASVKDIDDWLASDADQYIESIESEVKKEISPAERGKVRRNIEAIKERNHLKALLGDDYDLLDS